MRAVPALQHAVHDVSSGRVGERCELVEGPFGLFKWRRPKHRTDKQRPFTLGARGVGSVGLRRQLTTPLKRSTPSSSRSSPNVSEKRTKPSPDGP